MVQNRRLGMFLSVLLALANLQVLGCSSSSGVPDNIVFSYESDPNPPRIGLNTFTVTLKSASGGRIVGARVSLEGNMSHAGMAPVFGDAKEVGPGRYQGALDLKMRGDWTILCHVRLPSGVSFDREIDIRNIQAT